MPSAVPGVFDFLVLDLDLILHGLCLEVNLRLDGRYRDGFKLVDKHRDDMRSTTLTAGEQHLFAQAALSLKYESLATPVPITPEQLLVPRRCEDDRPDLWSAYNRVQEN